MFKEDTDDEMEEDNDNTQGGMASLFKQETDDEIEEDEDLNTTTACTLEPTHLKENKNVYACSLENENETVRDNSHDAQTHLASSLIVAGWIDGRYDGTISDIRLVVQLSTTLFNASSNELNIRQNVI